MSLLLQSDWDQAGFAQGSVKAPDRGRKAVASIPAPRDWDGRPSTLPGFDEFDPEYIIGCSEDYLGVARKDKKECPACGKAGCGTACQPPDQFDNAL